MAEQRDNTEQLLARIDERTARTERDVTDLRAEMRKGLSDLKGEAVANFVTRQEFQPVRAIVYGMVGVMMLAVLGALLALVVAK